MHRRMLIRQRDMDAGNETHDKRTQKGETNVRKMRTMQRKIGKGGSRRKTETFITIAGGDAEEK